MKILLVNDYREPIGGTEIYMNQIKTVLQKKGHQVEVFSTDKKNITIKKTLRKQLSLLFNFSTYMTFGNTFKDFKPDIVHVHGIFNELSPAFLMYLKNTPTIMSVHNNQLYSPVTIQTERTGKKCKNKICRGCFNCIGIKGTVYEFLKRLIQKQLYKNIDIYLGNSKFTNSQIDKLRLGKTIFIPFGVKLFDFSPLTTSNTIAYIGRLSKEKGLQFFLEAFKQITKNNADVNLIIVGDGPYRANLNNLIKRLHLQRHITFWGNITHDKLPMIYEKSSIIVLPAIWEEPLGITGIEALSAGRPVIGSRIGGIPEWLKNRKTGYLVKPGNILELTQKTLQLLHNKAILKKMSNQAPTSVQKYSLEQHVSSLEKIYRQTLQNYK